MSQKHTFIAKWKTCPWAKVCITQKSDADVSQILLFDPTHPTLPFFFTCALPLCYFSFLSVAPLIFLPTHIINTLFLSGLFNLSLLSFSSPPLQPARATSPVWCESHWTAIPWLHAHLYMSAWLLFGWRIRAQDLQVWWELDRETPSLCRYNYGYITSKKGNMEKNFILNMERHKWTLFCFCCC